MVNHGPKMLNYISRNKFKKSSCLNCMLFLAVWWNLAQSCSNLPWAWNPLWLSPHYICYLSVSHLVAFVVIRLNVTAPQFLLLSNTYCQKVNSSLKLHHNACITHLTSSHQVDIVSCHIITRREVSTGQ